MIIILTAISIAVSAIGLLVCLLLPPFTGFVLACLLVITIPYLVKQSLRHEMGCDCHPDYAPLEPRRFWR